MSNKLNHEPLKYRHEYKCRINQTDMLLLRQRLGNVMKHDLHSGDSGMYTVKSLYFDNCYDMALNEKRIGISRREKFRIRYYGNNLSFIRLEKKSKINGLCNKQSVIISEDECRDILNGKLCSVFDTDNELKRELYAKMNYRLLKPKSIVVYEREAFIYEPGNVRVTFDTNIRGSSDVGGFLNEDMVTVHLYNNVVLEIKWDEYLPQLIRDIVQLNTRSVSNFSKYAATRFI